MKVIIAGGRDYMFTLEDISLLDSLNSELNFSEVISGGARGADTEGEKWAKLRAIEVNRFPAQWKKFGRAAGMIRNKQMSKNADMLIAFPGGKGTANMIKIMKDLNKKVLEVENYVRPQW